ncbi:T-cell surface antigen CD2-like [Salminus brasiliensis]|uniref:T-cell surface antigen CD2-like n=1 Tax=Salminus brasiliensis TaxID=930266 RepID=UPI003B82E986
MNFNSSATLLFFCGLIISALEDSNTCNYTVAPGDILTIPFHNSIAVTDELRWTHLDSKESTLIVKWKNGKTIFCQKPYNMSKDGSLIIKHVTMKNKGNFKAEVHSSDGTFKGSQSIQLCVYEKVLKPNVSIICKEEKPSVQCEVNGKNNLTISWYENGKKIDAKENGVVLRNVKNNQMYECAVLQPTQSDKSEAIKAICDTGGHLLFGFDRWIMVGILAGGGALVLLLTIVLVTCACLSCKRREKHLQDEEEFRLNNLHTSPHTGQQRSKHTARGQPAPPVPQEDPEVSNYEVDEPPPKTQPRSKKTPRPPPPPIDDDEPPPLPQPRKNAPHTKKSKAPLYLQQ